MRKIFTNKSKNKIGVLLSIFVLTSVLFITVGYSVLNSELTISGEAHVRVSELIRITNLKVISKENGAYETYNNKYSKDTTSMFATLPSVNSTIIYEVTISNISTEQYQLENIIEESHTNENVDYEIIGLKVEDIIEENSDITFQIKFTTNMENQSEDLVLKYDFKKYEKHVPNDNLIKVYTYDQTSESETFCVTGEEETCVETDCYKSKKVDSCKAGDIVEYKVNETDIVKFHVMFDEGETITMQSQKNMINSQWIGKQDYGNLNGNCSYTSCTDEGPLIALGKISNLTANWSSVNWLNYCVGGPVYRNCFVSSCVNDACSYTPVYSLETVEGYARLISFSELKKLGCTRSSTDKCPLWVYNFLKNSSGYGGISEGDVDYYFSMTASTNANSSLLRYVYVVSDHGYITTGMPYYLGGIRPVVDVSK